MYISIKSILFSFLFNAAISLMTPDPPLYVIALRLVVDLTVSKGVSVGIGEDGTPGSPVEGTFQPSGKVVSVSPAPTPLV